MKILSFGTLSVEIRPKGIGTSKQIGNAILESFNGIGSQNRTRHRIRKDSIYLDKADNASVETIDTNAIPEPSPIEQVMWSPRRTNSPGQSLSLKMEASTNYFFV